MTAPAGGAFLAAAAAAAAPVISAAGGGDFLSAGGALTPIAGGAVGGGGGERTGAISRTKTMTGDTSGVFLAAAAVDADADAVGSGVLWLLDSNFVDTEIAQEIITMASKINSQLINAITCDLNAFIYSNK